MDEKGQGRRMIEFTVMGVPVAQPRARATARGGYARVYNPRGPVDTYKACVRLAARAAFAGQPIEGPVVVDMTLVFPRPKNRVWKKKPMPREWHTGKPDSDNSAKSVCDAVTGVVWRDDAQVAVLVVHKYVAAGNEQPHTVVKICRLGSVS